MGLVKSKGNMYNWIDYMHTHLAGQCPHKCEYCYVQRGVAKLSGKYKGKLRFLKEELLIKYGFGRSIFIEHMNDLFAKGVPGHWIADILAHCNRYPDNLYVFQTKNPQRVMAFEGRFPKDHIIGTTVETNYQTGSKAPSPIDRLLAIKNIKELGATTFITIEPIMDFDEIIFPNLIVDCNPDFVNIGADSKGSGLKEPSREKINYLISTIREAGIEIRQKSNLERLLTATERKSK